MPTYFAQVTYTGNGSTTSYAIPFSYIDSSHVKAYINGTITSAFTVSTSTLVFTSAPANGATIRIERQTPLDARLVDFADGSVLTEADLDRSANQNFFIAQEVADDAINNMAVDTDDKYNAQSKVIKNLANPVNANDAVNKTYLENTWLSTADKATLTNLNSNIASVNTVNTNIANVNTVASDLNEAVSEINTVAVDITNVNTVGTNIANVNTVAGNNANITTVAGANANITTVAGANANITTVAGQITPTNNISTVAGAVANIGTVATNVANVNIVGGAIANVNTVAGANANITTVATANTNIGTVATNVANVNLVGGSIANVNTVATNVANVNTVAGNNANINTVAGANANITTVAGISGAISTVASNAGNISTVATDIAKVITAANDLNEATSEIEVVANAIANVDTVGSAIANVNTVATNIANINSVNSNSTNINSVAGNSTNINSVASNSANINSVAGSIANVNAVGTNIGSVNDFAARYRVSATAPTTSLDLGDLYFDTTSNTMKVYSSGGFINAGSSVNGTANRYKYTATASQTTFTGADDNSNTLAYDAGFLDVYLNGIKLVNNSDFTASSGSSIVLAIGASASDILEVIAYGTFQLANFSIADANDVPPLGTAGQVLKVNSGATALEYGTIDLTNLNATNLTSGTLPDARFPATLPATSGANLTSLNASNLSSGTVSTARLGTGTANATNFLRGDNSWQTISTSPSQLVSSIPLASGASYTAGQLASINAVGEITSLPVLNTFGTTRTNSVITAYDAISDDGSTALKLVQTSPSGGSSRTLTITGVALSNSANPTNGGTTVVVTNNAQYGFTGLATSIVTPTSLGNNKFLITFATSYSYADGCGSTSTWRSITFIVEVNASTGNLTKGNEITYSGAGNNPAGFQNYENARLTKDIIYFRIRAANGTGSNITGIITWTGTTITLTSDLDASGFSGANGRNIILTSSNILGFGTGASWKTATWTASPVGIGTVSTTTQIADYQDEGNWAKMCAFGTDAPEYVIATYRNTDFIRRYITYSVNQTTGALTQVETGTLLSLNNYDASMYVFKDKNSFVAVNGASSGTLSFTNGTKNTPAFNTPYSLTTVRYNSGDLFYNFSTDIYSYPTNTGYTVNAYATNVFNFIGVVKTTDSTSPIDIVTNGVAGGFTGLTAGVLYYTTTPADGSVSTSSASGILVGKAISTTEILLMKSNSN